MEHRKITLFLSEEFEVKSGINQVFLLSRFLFVVVVNVFAREGTLSESLYADCLVLMSETIQGHWSKFLRWKEAIKIIKKWLV